MDMILYIYTKRERERADQGHPVTWVALGLFPFINFMKSIKKSTVRVK